MVLLEGPDTAAILVSIVGDFLGLVSLDKVEIKLEKLCRAVG